MPRPSKINAIGAATGQINAVLEASGIPPEGSKMLPIVSRNRPEDPENDTQPGLRVEYRPLEALIPFAGNPRAHSDEQVAQIAASIKEFGFTNPILLDGENGVISGHGRLAAARVLGLKTVPCIELGHLSEAQKRAYIIADNKLSIVEIKALASYPEEFQLVGNYRTRWAWVGNSVPPFFMRAIAEHIRRDIVFSDVSSRGLTDA